MIYFWGACVSEKQKGATMGHRNRTLFGFALENNCTSLLHSFSQIVSSPHAFNDPFCCAKVRSARSGAPPPNCYLIFHWFCFKFSISRCRGFSRTRRPKLPPALMVPFSVWAHRESARAPEPRIFVCCCVFFRLWLGAPDNETLKGKSRSQELLLPRTTLLSCVFSLKNWNLPSCRWGVRWYN